MTSDNTIITQWGSKAVTFAALSDEKRHERMKICADIIDKIKVAVGIDVSLSYGCLLGAVRANKMIDHDFDVDLSFFLEGDISERLYKTRKLIDYLYDISEDIKLETNGQFKITVKDSTGGAFGIDFFASWIENNKYYLYFAIPGVAIAEDILPFGKIEIEGVQIKSPKIPESIVAAIYGKNWKTPDPNFRYSNIKWEKYKQLFVNNNKEYWDNYYASGGEKSVWAEYPSQFAAFCASEFERPVKIMDFGAGNGRDSVFFANLGHDVSACDYSEQALIRIRGHAKAANLDIKTHMLNVCDAHDLVKFSREKECFFDVLYSRFAMHAISKDGQESFLELARNIISPNGLLMLEFRNSMDDRKKTGIRISESERSDGHYRRFVDTDEFVGNALKYGFRVLYRVEGNGFAKFRDEDPNVTRLILSRK